MPGARRFPAPKDLPLSQKRIWTEIMNALPSGWFGRENLHLLRLLCHYLVMSETALTVINSASSDDSESRTKLISKYMDMLNKATDHVIRLSFQLRLTPKSRSDGSARKRDETASRANPIRPWEMSMSDEARDEHAN